LHRQAPNVVMACSIGRLLRRIGVVGERKR